MKKLYTTAFLCLLSVSSINIAHAEQTTVIDSPNGDRTVVHTNSGGYTTVDVNGTNKSGGYGAEKHQQQVEQSKNGGGYVVRDSNN